MKKRVLGSLLAMLLVIAQVVCVSAASKEAGAGLTGDSVGKYEISAFAEADFEELKEAAPEVFELIKEITEGTASLQDIAQQAPELEEKLEDKDLLTPFFDLKVIGEGVKTADGKYLVTLSVPTLTDKVTEVQVLHYSEVRKLWEIIEPDEVDLVNKEITAQFEDLSPVAIIAKVEGDGADQNNDQTTTGGGSKPASGGASGTSPKTGASASWVLWIGLGAVLLGGVGIVLRKSRI